MMALHEPSPPHADWHAARESPGPWSRKGHCSEGEGGWRREWVVGWSCVNHSGVRTRGASYNNDLRAPQPPQLPIPSAHPVLPRLLPPHPHSPLPPPPHVRTSFDTAATLSPKNFQSPAAACVSDTGAGHSDESARAGGGRLWYGRCERRCASDENERSGVRPRIGLQCRRSKQLARHTAAATQCSTAAQRPRTRQPVQVGGARQAGLGRGVRGASRPAGVCNAAAVRRGVRRGGARRGRRSGPRRRCADGGGGRQQRGVAHGLGVCGVRAYERFRVCSERASGGGVCQIHPRTAPAAPARPRKHARAPTWT